MNDFIHEPFGLSPNPLLQPDQNAQFPAGASLVQANQYTLLPLHDGGMPTRMHELQYSLLMEANQQPPAVTLPFEAMGSGNQLFPFNPNFGGLQGNLVSNSSGSFLSFGRSVAGLPQWNQVNGAAQAGIAANDLFGLQAAIEHNARVRAIQNQQYAMDIGFLQPPFNFPFLSDTMFQQLAPDATQNQPLYEQQNPGPSSVPYQPNAMAQHLTFKAPHQQAPGYQQPTGVPAEAYPLQNVATGDQSSVPDLSDATDSLRAQMQHLTTSSPLVGEVVSPARYAIEDDIIHDPVFPEHHLSAATHQPDGLQGIGHKQTRVPPLDRESQDNIGDPFNEANHNDATNAFPEQVQHIITESPVTDELVTPLDHNVHADDFVAIPAEPKEQVQDFAPVAMLVLVPPQGVPPTAESPAEPSPVGAWVDEQAGPASAPGNAPLVAEVPTTKPGTPQKQIKFVYCIHPSERGSTASSSRDLTPPTRNWTRFSPTRVPKAVPASSFTNANKREEGPPAKRARVTHWQGIRENLASPSVDTRADESVEVLPLFAPLPANDAIPGHSTEPGQVGPSAHYYLRNGMTLYDVFVAMREENDRNRAAGLRNANGDVIFTWDESDIRLFDSLCRSSRR